MTFLPGFSKKIIKVGKILHKSPIASNILIAKVNGYIEEGTEIYDQETRKIGVAIETFGPTNSPYLRIKVDKNLDIKENTEIFTIEGEKRNVSWRKKPRRRKRINKRGKNWKQK